MTSSQVSGMPTFRTTLLIITLGSAAAIGGLCYPTRSTAEIASRGRSVDGAVILPLHAHSHGRHAFPVRNRTRTHPDPTPDDFDGEPGIPVNLDNDGPDWIIQEAGSVTATWGLISSPSPAWTEPAGYTLLLQMTRRFRC
jgi:hypothetical protein